MKRLKMFFTLILSMLVLAMMSNIVFAGVTDISGDHMPKYETTVVNTMINFLK